MCPSHEVWAALRGRWFQLLICCDLFTRCKVVKRGNSCVMRCYVMTRWSQSISSIFNVCGCDVRCIAPSYHAQKEVRNLGQRHACLLVVDDVMSSCERHMGTNVLAAHDVLQ